MLKFCAAIVYLMGAAIIVVAATSMVGGKATITAPDWMTYSPLKPS
jgi:hypothetical protein